MTSAELVALFKGSFFYKLFENFDNEVGDAILLCVADFVLSDPDAQYLLENCPKIANWALLNRVFYILQAYDITVASEGESFVAEFGDILERLRYVKRDTVRQVTREYESDDPSCVNCDDSTLNQAKLAWLDALESCQAATVTMWGAFGGSFFPDCVKPRCKDCGSDKKK